MGIKTKWVVVRDMPKAEVLDVLGVVETGEAEGLDVAPMAVADLGNGWVAVHWGEFEEWKPEQVAQWFPKGEVLFGSIYDVVGFSIAHGMRDSQPTWTVKSDPEEEPGVQTQGALPADFEAVSRRLQRRQGEEDPDVEEVSDLGELPAELVRAITGYDPARSYIGGPEFQIVERRRTGAAGERQAADRRLRERLAEVIDAEVIPAAEALGFQRAGHLDWGPLDNGPRTLARYREGRSELLEPFWHFPDGATSIGFRFFVRSGEEYPRGDSGLARTPPPKRTLGEVFTGRKEGVDDGLARAVREAKDLLGPLDEHLRNGTAHPHIRPATYYENR